MKLLIDYLSNRYQRIKVEGNFSTWEELLTGVHQGSALGPMLFNICLDNLFYAVKDADILQLCWKLLRIVAAMI